MSRSQNPEPGGFPRCLKRLWFAALLVPLCVRADGLAHSVRDTELRAEPSPAAAVVRTLPSGTNLTVAERRGAWFRAYLEDDTAGWVRLLAVRYYPPTASGSLADTVSKATRSETTVSTGVRGLDRERLSGSQPDPVRLRRLLDFRYTATDARRFAAEGGLRAREESYP